MNVLEEHRKTIRGRLRKSIATAPAEAALRKADNIEELEVAWDTHCDGFPDESMEREFLLTVYQDKAAQFAVELSRYLRAG